MTTDALVGWSALVAASATVIGAVTLGLFFAKGGLWGPLNDVASIVLMLATIPVALAIPVLLRPGVAGLEAIAAIGVTGMVGASVSQGLLVARVRTYEQLLPWTLGFGAVVGAWYLLSGLAGIRPGVYPSELDLLAIVSGLGFIGVGIGFWRGGEESRLAMASGVALLVASTAFFTWLALDLLGGQVTLAGAT